MMNDTIHPIENRYKTKEMAKIFTQSAKLYRWLRVEAALAHAHASLERIPKNEAEEIDRKANLEFVKLERVKEIEDEIHHDLMAMVRALSEKCEGNAGKYIHLGATSYDIEDTATAIQMVNSLDVLTKTIHRVLKILIKQADKNKKLICVGRTHGQQALPTTYGMRFGVWASEIARHLERIDQIRPRIAVGKMSGAVGTMASFGEDGVKIQKKVMEILAHEFNIPLTPATIENQVIQRDRHAEVLNLTALIGGTIDKIAREMRILQRTEIGEMFEAFGKKQVGSSTMPHKRNPHKAERLCSIARVLKSNIIIGIDNIGLEDERDLTNSANERIIFAENFILLDYMLHQLAQILEWEEFNLQAIQRNLNFTHGAFLAEKIMVDMVNKGIGRQEGHEILRLAAIKARELNLPMKEILIKDISIKDKFTENELDELLKPENYLGSAVSQVENLIEILKKKYQIEL
ncbi:adenylosuccinate lyase [Promethearchaeum syntrophicum]|uniref:Adenylosuccinate lyase n=1 Tax=Promethearchaeum syntrophicum TaxID=2594042 RepID=A0A5B9D8X2_9ARCH|nr:adenylosuccinate lyase [Candidatus Prometheoarchaeum syntrophicum]QEE15718.1 adenylosuccinate lyase [Candidatus Prometheoarchaeum syntrophicum]